MTFVQIPTHEELGANVHLLSEIKHLDTYINSIVNKCEKVSSSTSFQTNALIRKQLTTHAKFSLPTAPESAPALEDALEQPPGSIG